MVHQNIIIQRRHQSSTIFKWSLHNVKQCFCFMYIMYTNDANANWNKYAHVTMCVLLLPCEKCTLSKQHLRFMNIFNEPIAKPIRL